MTRAELLEGRTDTPVLTDAQFAEAWRLAVAEFQAEKFIKRCRRRGRRAKHRDLMTDEMDGLLTGADVAELLSGQA